MGRPGAPLPGRRELIERRTERRGRGTRHHGDHGLCGGGGQGVSGGGECRRGEHRTGDVEATARLLVPVLRYVPVRDRDGEGRERHVDEEDPAPSRAAHEPPAEQRPPPPATAETSHVPTAAAPVPRRGPGLQDDQRGGCRREEALRRRPAGRAPQPELGVRREAAGPARRRRNGGPRSRRWREHAAPLPVAERTAEQSPGPPASRIRHSRASRSPAIHI